MGKPLLTDEIIERAKRGEKLEDIGRGFKTVDEKTKVIRTDNGGTRVIHFDKRDFETMSSFTSFTAINQAQMLYEDESQVSQEYYTYDKTLEDTIPISMDSSVVKSRRIEHEKLDVFKSKLNRILMIILILLVILILAVLYL